MKPCPGYKQGEWQRSSSTPNGWNRVCANCGRILPDHWTDPPPAPASLRRRLHVVLQWLFPVGRRSLLWGVHNVVWHPWTVYRAWVGLYGRPTWREVICIIVHDWGYWSAPNIDGPEGQRHPEAGARLAGGLLGPAYRDLVLFHSRQYVKRENEARAERLLAAVRGGIKSRGRTNPADDFPVSPSKLCWADKLSILYDPPWFYLLRARRSGELAEYRANGASSGFCPANLPDTTWLGRLHAHNIMTHAREAGNA